MITKQLTGTGKIWTHYLQPCTYAYNSFMRSALNSLSPFQLAYGRPSKALLDKN